MRTVKCRRDEEDSATDTSVKHTDSSTTSQVVSKMIKFLLRIIIMGQITI